MYDDLPSRSNTPTRPGLEPISLLAGGQTIGRFRLIQLLGEGGMGSVWLAEDPIRKDDVRDGRVVLKFLRDDIRRCPEAVEQFKSGYRKVQLLFHEHICPLLDLGDDPTFGAFQVMPFVKGMTLLELLKKEDPDRKGLPLERVIAILQPVAKALEYAHREGLVHRDIKPGNIMVDPETGKVFVVDFGLAAEVRTSMSMHSRSGMQVSGTEPYMAPEQWMGQAQDGRSDQYSLAVVAWQMLTGSLPYQGSGMPLGFAVTQGPIPELPETLQHLQQVLAKAMAKDRKGRFETPQAFIQALATVKHSTGAQSRDDMQRLLAQLPKEPPKPVRSPLLVAPFDAKQAKAAQDAWAKHLGIGTEVTNGIGMKFRVIPPGTFDMGSPESEPQRYDDETLHKVTITQPKLLGVYPVTQAEWTKVMGSNPSYFTTVSGQDTSRFPVEQVSWDDCQKFLKRLNKSHAMKGWRYRLPTEAEWEYACRAGTVTPFWFGGELNGTQANCDGNRPYQTGKCPYLQRPSVVGSYGANPFGLYDQHGNVWEGCQDWYGAYDASVHQDPRGPSSGSSRVLRGGSWRDGAFICRSADRRYSGAPSLRSDCIGFRLLCELS